MYKTELIEDITVENVTEKIDEKIKEMEKKKLLSCHYVFFRDTKSCTGI